MPELLPNALQRRAEAGGLGGHFEGVPSVRPFSELNINEGGRPVTLSPPTPTEIEEFESELGAKLPPLFVALLNHANGGHPEVDTITNFETGALTQWGIDHFFYLNSDVKGWRSLWRALRYWKQFVGGRILPFGEDGGGNLFYLDLESPTNPAYVCIHDEGHRTLLLATSFESLLDGLAIDPDCN